MEAIPISAVLLRGLLPDVKLTPGTFVTGRVLDPKTLNLAGVKLAARLPDGVVPGQVLRMQVQEATSERIHLKVLEPGSSLARAAQAAEAPQVPADAYQVALPGGILAQIHVQERERAAGRKGGAPATSVVVRYDSPTLGRLDVRLDDRSAAVHVAAGEPAATVADAAAALSDALARATGNPTRVTVHPRGFDRRA
ncbi:MAG TPA: hypothetical protein VFG42_18775 [Baekduia sp.]|uniref:hypothetical protein n=1 Tax=Baekduia sp. TaxID=2600305 RepID=UPI002D79984B|nr:hypothetical protein [Baekduia sp.]HET6508844.1 hypothetical protein [Baekduia sp.]